MLRAARLRLISLPLPLMVALLLTLLAGAAQSQPRAAIEINTARAVVAAGVAHPRQIDFAAGRDTALPDNWLRTRPGLHGTVWYAVPLDAALAALAALPAGTVAERVVLVPRAADRGEFWLNGERLESGGGGGNTRNQALWLALPAHALRPHGNLLQVRLEGNGEVRDGLSALTLGTPEALRPTYEGRRLLQTILPLALLFMVVGTTFATLPLWLKTRRRAHLLFLLLCLCWLPRGLAVLRPTAGNPSEAALTLIAVTSLFSGVMIALLVLDFLGAQGRFWHNYRRALVGLASLLSAVAVLWAALAGFNPRGFALLMTPVLALMMVALLAQVRAAFLDPRPLHVATALALCAWTVTVAHDFATLGDFTAFDAVLWSPTSAFAVFLALIWRTIAGLALARGGTDAEVHNAVSRVADAHGRALEQMRIEYDRRKEDERNAVIAAERSRLLHDLHDGMGSQLITALRMTRRDGVPREEVARVIEDALEDMRLIIDSLDLAERDLLELLGNLRFRLEPRLNAIGVALQWDVEPLPELDYLSPETGLAIVRIVQEAVNNALRHGGARTITVHARAAGAGIELWIADDGSGFDTARTFEPGAAHRGLGAMRARAARLGGSIHFSSSAEGTRVELMLPLHREHEPQARR